MGQDGAYCKALKVYSSLPLLLDVALPQDRSREPAELNQRVGFRV